MVKKKSIGPSNYVVNELISYKVAKKAKHSKAVRGIIWLEAKYHSIMALVLGGSRGLTFFSRKSLVLAHS